MAWHTSARLWTALAAGLIALAVATVALVEVTTTGPRVTVQWRADIAPADRLALERRYDLQGGEPHNDSGCRPGRHVCVLVCARRPVARRPGIRGCDGGVHSRVAPADLNPLS